MITPGRENPLAPPLVRLQDVVPEATQHERYAVGDYAQFVSGELKGQVGRVISGAARLKDTTRPAGVRLRMESGLTYDVWDYRLIVKVAR